MTRKVFLDYDIWNNNHKVFFVKWHTNNLGGIFGKKTYAHIDGSAVKGFLDFIRIPFKETDGNAGMFFVKNLKDWGEQDLGSDVGTSYGKGTSNKAANVQKFFLQIAFQGQ